MDLKNVEQGLVAETTQVRPFGPFRRGPFSIVMLVMPDGDGGVAQRCRCWPPFHLASNDCFRPNTMARKKKALTLFRGTAVTV